jgi:hypothetical protein
VMKSKSLATLLVVLIAGILPAVARAEQPGPHPRYLHALSDLRAARANIERGGGDPQIKWDERTAIAEIDATIREIKEASINDGKDLNDHPQVDVKLNWNGRLHRGLDLLRAARKDVNEEESNDFAHGLKHRALKHIDQAIHFVKQGIENAKQ